MKNCKIVRLAGMSSKSAIDALYAKYPGLDSAPYNMQQQKIFENAYMYSDFFSKEMRGLGYSAEEIVYDVLPLQKQWMKEQGLPFVNKQWQYHVVLSQLSRIQPDIVFFQDIHSLSFELRASLKQRIPSIKKIVIFRGFPGVDENLFRELSIADLLLVGSPTLVRKCREQGLNPHLVYHYFDPSILQKLPPGNQQMIDFSFIGSSGFGYEAHRDRYEMLLELLRKTQIDLWIDEPHEKLSLKQKIRYIASSLVQMGLGRCSHKILDSFRRWPIPNKIQNLVVKETEKRVPGYVEKPRLVPLRQLFSERCNPPLFGLEMFELLQRSKIALNRHSMPAEGMADNIRLFQATGVGTCLLTDRADNMKDLFEVDREVVTYSSLDECIEKSKYLLEHEEIRRAIAEAGQKRTLKDHTAKARIQQISHLIEDL